MKKITAILAVLLFCSCDVPWKIYDQADICICEHTFKYHPKGEGICLVDSCTCEGFFFIENGEDDPPEDSSTTGGNENVRDTSETSQSNARVILHPGDGNLNREAVQSSIRLSHE